jgi:CheY-like chemotaxis protein
MTVNQKPGMSGPDGGEPKLGHGTFAAAKKGLVLCVDDDPTSLKLARLAVEAAGHNYLGAQSGAECLGLLHRLKPNIILLDIVMPGMDGVETCRQIRANFRRNGARIVFLTALNGPTDIARALGTDADDYLVKPINFERLKERLDHWIQVGPWVAPD